MFRSRLNSTKPAELPTRPARLAALTAAAAFVSAGCDLAAIDPDPPRKPPTERSTFVNWETPHVSPLALARNGALLLAVNTADNRLEVFATGDRAALTTDAAPGDSGGLRARASIPVGLDPVAVRVRDDGSAWVANHVSDTISIVDLEALRVVRTLATGDEPGDIAFAGGRAFVTCSQINQLWVYDLADLDRPPLTLDIRGEDPRALAVSADGATIYAAIFESGNRSTLVPWEGVSDPNSPYGGQNPPPNHGGDFLPPIAAPDAPPVSLIVRKEPATGAWRDDNGGDWRDFISWDMHDHDVAVIDAATLEVRYLAGLMTSCMHLTAGPDGRLYLIGTEARNEIRFEPNLTGHFVRTMLAVADPGAAKAAAGSVRGGADSGGDAVHRATHSATAKAPPLRVDLNPHLKAAYDAGQPRVSADLRRRSLADPRAIVFEASGRRGYVSGLGSNNVAIIDPAGARLGEIAVAEGPTGLALDEPHRRLYVLNRFAASISVIDTERDAVVQSVAFFDPTPPEIKAGRPFLYDAHRTSGLGVTACAACHLDGRTDQLAWDLGDPAGAVKTFNQECNRPFLDLPVGACEDWHPLKGPMTTQTLQNIIGTEPLHWRGDRENLHAFNPAFVGLLGRESELTDEEMRQFEAFLATIRFPPNPHRNRDGSLREWLDLRDPGVGSPRRGEEVYFSQRIDLALARCADCHDYAERGAGTNRRITPRNLLINPNQSIDVPQIRNIYEKIGFSRARQDNNVGFGHNHDGTIDGMINFFHIPNFTGFSDGALGEQERRDVISFVMSLGLDTHPAVGTQFTLSRDCVDAGAGGAGLSQHLRRVWELIHATAGAPRAASNVAPAGAAAILADAGDDTMRSRAQPSARIAPAADCATLDLLIGLADADEIGLIAQGGPGPRVRGWMYVGGGRFEGDMAGESLSLRELLLLAQPGGELTFTAVPNGSQRRLAIDRDLDGILDGDESP